MSQSTGDTKKKKSPFSLYNRRKKENKGGIKKKWAPWCELCFRIFVVTVLYFPSCLLFFRQSDEHSWIAANNNAIGRSLKALTVFSRMLTC